MWIASVTGWYSAVCPRSDDGRGREIEADKIMVRARAFGHLHALQRRFPALAGAEIIVTPRADYRYRLIVPKAVWAKVVAAMVMEVDYDNFKDAAAREQGPDERGYVGALHRVWSVMHALQAGEE